MEFRCAVAHVVWFVLSFEPWAVLIRDVFSLTFNKKEKGQKKKLKKKKSIWKSIGERREERDGGDDTEALRITRAVCVWTPHIFDFELAQTPPMQFPPSPPHKKNNNNNNNHFDIVCLFSPSSLKSLWFHPLTPWLHWSRRAQCHTGQINDAGKKQAQGFVLELIAVFSFLYIYLKKTKQQKQWN